MSEPAFNDGFTRHAEQLDRVRAAADARCAEVAAGAAEHLAAFCATRQTQWVQFSEMTAGQLAAVLRRSPALLKPLLELVNAAGRALERELGIVVKTYEPRLTASEAARIAEWLLPLLPEAVPVEALTALDRRAFVDKEMRRNSGNWEQEVIAALNARAANHVFRKAKLTGPGGRFEVDAAAMCRSTGQIAGGVDIKRINGIARDVLNRARDIRDTAVKFKTAHPGLELVAIVYYPYPQRQREARERILAEAPVREVFFASEDPVSLDAAAVAALELLGLEMTGKAPVFEAPPEQERFELTLFD
jgi:hypothetical protein